MKKIKPLTKFNLENNLIKHTHMTLGQLFFRRTEYVEVVFALIANKYIVCSNADYIRVWRVKSGSAELERIGNKKLRNFSAKALNKCEKISIYPTGKLFE